MHTPMTSADEDPTRAARRDLEGSSRADASARRSRAVDRFEAQANLCVRTPVSPLDPRLGYAPVSFPNTRDELALGRRHAEFRGYACATSGSWGGPSRVAVVRGTMPRRPHSITRSTSECAPNAA